MKKEGIENFESLGFVLLSTWPSTKSLHADVLNAWLNSHLNFGKVALVLYLTYRKLLNVINLWVKPTKIQPF